jgi:segregation and condensation protein B
MMTTDETTPDLVAALECVLFMATRPLALGELGELLNVSPPAARQLLELLEGRYLGMQVVEVAGGWQLATKPEFAEYVAQLHRPPKFRLSPSALETLAIVAYRQPITRPEVEALRGVNSDSVITTLLDREFIRECGHRNTPGRPMLYGTTDKFLQMFGLASLDALPDLATFIEQQQAVAMEGYTADE